MTLQVAPRPPASTPRRTPARSGVVARAPTTPAPAPPVREATDALGQVLAGAVRARAADLRRTPAVAASGVLARYTTREVKQRAQEIREERGRPGEGATTDQEEARAQLGATEREIERRAAAIFAGKGIAAQDMFDDEFDRIMARVQIREEFICDRLEAWNKIIFSRPLWRVVGMAMDPAEKVKNAQNKLAKLVGLLTGHDLKAQRKAIEAAEAAIAEFVTAYGTALPERSDLLMMVKRYTLGYEWRKLVIAERIADRYGMRLDSMELVKANKKSYGNKSLEQFIEMIEPEVFSLEELQGIESVLSRYAPMLGKNRAKKLGAQSLTIVGRGKYGVDYDAAGEPVSDPGTRGESFGKSKTVGMYDEGARGTQFPTGMQQFRGTLAHELSHALIENVKNQNGETILRAYATATGVWNDPWDTDYQGASSDETWQAMSDAGKEPPITTYGATNAQEDLADAIKFLFEDPAKLKASCPRRYRWIVQNLGSFFEATWFTGLPAPPP